MVIEIKKIVPMLVRSISGKDMVEFLVYMYYVMKDTQLNQLCGAKTDVKVWHVLYMSFNQNPAKLSIEKYIHFVASSEESLLQFRPDILIEFKLLWPFFCFFSWCIYWRVIYTS